MTKKTLPTLPTVVYGFVEEDQFNPYVHLADGSITSLSDFARLGKTRKVGVYVLTEVKEVTAEIKVT